MNTIFDICLSAIAGIAFWFSIQPQFYDKRDRFPVYLLLIIILCTLPKGSFWVVHERPEALGFTLIIISILIAGYDLNIKRAFAASIIIGINLMVSPFSGIINGIALFISFLAIRFSKGSFYLFNIFLYFLASLTGIIVPILLVATIVYIHDPLAIPHFLGHALGTSTGGHSGLGYVLYGNYLKGFFIYNIFSPKIRLLFLLITIISSVIYLMLLKPLHRKVNLLLLWSILFMGFFPILIIPYGNYYMSLTAALIMVLLARLSVIESEKEGKLLRWTIIIPLAFIAFFEILFIGREFIIAYENAPSFHRMQKVLNKYKNYKNPLFVATSPATYFLFKGNGFDPVNIYYLHNPHDIDRMDLIALSYYGSQNPNKPNLISMVNSDKYENIYRPILPQKTKLFGHVISNSSNTWEVDLYKNHGSAIRLISKP